MSDNEFIFKYLYKYTVCDNSVLLTFEKCDATIIYSVHKIGYVNIYLAQFWIYPVYKYNHTSFVILFKVFK